MRRDDKFLAIGIALSFLLHGAFFLFMKKVEESPVRRAFKHSQVITFEVKTEKKPQPKPEPKKIVKKVKPKPKPKPKPEPKKVYRVKKVAKFRKKTVNEAPVSHVRKKPDGKVQDTDVKPVFGVTKKSVVAGKGSGIGVRVGNTLMKEQEKEYTPPEKVKDYYAGNKLKESKIDPNIKKFTTAPVPSFELSSLPVYKSRVKPEYPEELLDEELEGEVLLTVLINEKGRVISVKVKRSDHALFSKAAKKAMKKTRFKPGMIDGKAVATSIDIPVKFVMDI